MGGSEFIGEIQRQGETEKTWLPVSIPKLIFHPEKKKKKAGAGAGAGARLDTVHPRVPYGEKCRSPLSFPFYECSYQLLLHYHTSS
ncbi:hypothetical protein MRB53_013474 [Persea americana]|uniref:Uncharacterized protein n=1 Tax=Persea americana TaxID=3435 RepID=A0ACC2K822_PERAE|nr:hypothetical protein MRB53_013474 [Persea americana]